MKETRLRQLIAFSLLTLIFFAVLLFVYRDLVRQYVVIPIYYILWAARRIIYSVPQVMFLLGLVGIGLLLAVGSLRYLITPTGSPKDHPLASLELSRYQFWRRRCHSMETNAFHLTGMGIELRQFLLSVLAYQENRETWAIEQEIINGEFVVPQEVHELIVQHRMRTTTQETQKGQSLWEKLRQHFGFFTKEPVKADMSPEQTVEKILSYLEQRLEVDRD